MFPEILGNSTTKYQRFALWLATNCSVINTNIRDQFSAGGKVTIQTINGTFENMPAAFGRIEKYHELIEETINNMDESLLLEYWEVNHIEANRMEQWCRYVANYTENVYQTHKMLCSIFAISMN